MSDCHRYNHTNHLRNKVMKCCWCNFSSHNNKHSTFPCEITNTLLFWQKGSNFHPQGTYEVRLLHTVAPRGAYSAEQFNCMGILQYDWINIISWCRVPWADLHNIAAGLPHYASFKRFTSCYDKCTDVPVSNTNGITQENAGNLVYKSSKLILCNLT